MRGAAARPSASAWAVPLQPLYNGQAPLAWVVGTAMLMIADLWHPPAADPQLAAFGSTIVSSSQVVCSASACLQQHTHTDAHSHKQCKVSGQDRSENCGPLLQQLSLSRLLTFMLRPVLASAPVTHAPAIVVMRSSITVMTQSSSSPHACNSITSMPVQSRNSQVVANAGLDMLLLLPEQTVHDK